MDEPKKIGYICEKHQRRKSRVRARYSSHSLTGIMMLTVRLGLRPRRLWQFQNSVKASEPRRDMYRVKATAVKLTAGNSQPTSQQLCHSTWAAAQNTRVASQKCLSQA
jgi:hypothetical protein